MVSLFSGCELCATEHRALPQAGVMGSGRFQAQKGLGSNPDTVTSCVHTFLLLISEIAITVSSSESQKNVGSHKKLWCHVRLCMSCHHISGNAASSLLLLPSSKAPSTFTLTRTVVLPHRMTPQGVKTFGKLWLDDSTFSPSS